MEQARFGDRTVAEATLTQSLNIKYSAPPNAVLSALSAAVFWGLQGRIRQTCKSLYPIVSTCTFAVILTGVYYYCCCDCCHTSSSTAMLASVHYLH
jgi:hypothetical protein